LNHSQNWDAAAPARHSRQESLTEKEFLTNGSTLIDRENAQRSSTLPLPAGELSARRQESVAGAASRGAAAGAGVRVGEEQWAKGSGSENAEEEGEEEEEEEEEEENVYNHSRIEERQEPGMRELLPPALPPPDLPPLPHMLLSPCGGGDVEPVASGASTVR